MKDAYTLDAAYRGVDSTIAALKSGTARPLGLASADFDRNGTPDLVIGYAVGGAGRVVVQRGNPEAFAPTDESIYPRLHRGYDPQSLLPEADVHATPAAPDFIVTGRLTHDAQDDIVFAQRGGALFVLEGDGRGGFAAARAIALPGRVTALAAGEFRAADGHADLAVGIATPKGHSLLVFDDASGDFTVPSIELTFDAAVVAIELGTLDGDPFQDLVAVTDHEMAVVHGWGRNEQAKAAARTERFPLAPGVRGLALGEFVWDRAGRVEIATLASDGTVRIVRGADLDTRPFDAAEKAARTRGTLMPQGEVVRDVEATPSWQAKGAAGWTQSVAFATRGKAAVNPGVARPLLRANLMYREADDLMLVGGDAHAIDVVHEVSLQQKAGGDAAALQRSAFALPGEPVAVMALPRKVNGVRDFVVLDASKPEPTLLPQAPKAIIAVDRFDDSASASACTGAANDCSLRGAILFTNIPANAGSTINFPAGTYSLTINGTTANGCGNPENGDLGANQSMTLVGAGSASTIIRQLGTGPANDGDRIMCMNETFLLNLQYTFSGLTFIGGRDGNATDNTGSTLGGTGIIGGEFNNALTLNNVVFANNQNRVQGSANLGGGGIQITGGNLTINNSTIGGSAAPGTYADRSATNTANSQESSGAGVAYTPSSPAHTGGTGILNVTGTTVSRNVSNGIGGGGFDLLIFAFASPGGIGSGSATIGTTSFSNNTGNNGGGIVVESLPTTVTESSFTANHARNRGGGIYVGGGSLLLNGVSTPITFTNNTATNAASSISTASQVNVAGTMTTIGGEIEVSTGGTWTNNTGSTLSPTNVIVTGGTFNMNNSTMNVGGNLTIVPAPVVGGIFNANSGALNIAGNFSFTNGGNPASAFNAGTSTVTFNGTGAQSISNAVSITFNNLVDANVTQPLTLNNSLAVNGTLNVNGANAILSPVAATVVSGTGTLTGTGTVRASRVAAAPDFLSQYTITNKTLTNLTVDYNGAGAQTVNNVPAYRHLRVSGSGIKTLQGNTSITGNLNIAAATLASGNFGFGLGGNWTLAAGAGFTPGTGTVTFNGTTGTQLLSGNTTFFNVTLDNAGANTSFGTTTTTIGNDLVATAGTMLGGTSTIAFTGTGDNAGSISGAAAKNFHNLHANSPATISNASGGNVTIENDFAATGTFTQGSGVTTIFATDDNGNTTHGLSGGGPTTFGSVLISPTNSVDAGSHSVNVAGGSFLVGTTGTFTGNATTTFNGALAQQIAGPGAKNFNNLTVNNASGVQVLDDATGVDATVFGTLTLTTDLTTAGSAILQQSGTSAGAGDVIGTVRRTDLGTTTRAFGNPNNQVTIDTGTPPTQLDFTLAKTNPAGFPAGVKVVPRAVTMTPTGGGAIQGRVRLRYVDPAELTGAAIDENRLTLWQLLGGTWTPQGGTLDAAGNFVTRSGLSSLTQFALAEASDLILTKSNSVSNAAVVGQPWTWSLRATNEGTPATFTSGQTILTDTLPNANATYGAVSVQNVSNITGSANIACAIASNTLTCTATGGDVRFDSNVGASRFDVVFNATAQSVGSFQNPRAGGNAQIDPGTVVVESNETNNVPATNTITVGKAGTTTTISSHTPDPSVLGTAVTVQWSVVVNAPGALGAALTGNVTVSDGTNSCVAAVSAGQCAVTLNTAGARNLTATYAGDANYNGSASAATPHTVTVVQPTIAKAFAPATIVAQDTSVVTLTLVNANGLALTNASFTDTLSNMSAAGGAVTGTCTGTTPSTLSAGATALSFSGITIPTGASGCTVVFSVTSSVPGTLPNTTSGVTTTQSPAAGAASNTANLTVTPRANLGITKTDGVAMAVPGNPVIYTITASNAGPNAATGATVTDTFPGTLSGCTWTCVGAGGGTCTAAGSGNIADTANLPNGGSTTYTATCTLSPSAAGNLTNTATVAAPAGTTDPSLANNSATDVDTLPPRDLTLAKANNVGNAAVVGQPWTWTVTAANAGAPAAFAAGQSILLDDLPSGMTYGAVTVQNVSNITGSANIGCSITSNTLGCVALGPVSFDSNVGASSFQVAFAATSQSAGARQNPRAGGNALVDPSDVVSESDEGNNAAAANTVTVAKAGTTTTIASHSPDPSVVGIPLTVQWNVAVNAPGALGDALTGNVTVSDGTASCMAAVAAGQCAITFASAGGRNLTATYAGDANYDSSASAPTPHTVVVNAPTIAKAFAPAAIAAGSSTAVTLTLSNSNGIALTNASFSDALTSMSAAGGAVTGTCTGTTPSTLVAAATALSFSGISIPAQGSCTVVFSVTSTTLGVLPNTTSGVTTTQTPVAGAVSNTATLTVQPGADLSITNTDGVTTAIPGNSVTYTIVASNGGPSDVTGATVTDSFPASLSGCGWTCAPGSGACTAAGFGPIADSGVNLPNGASVTYTATCTLSAAAVGTLSNTATIAAPDGVIDPVSGNNTATDVDTLPPRPDLTVAKSHAGTFTQGDVGRTYDIVVTNSGDAPTNGSIVTVTDVVPAGLTPTAASGTGWACAVDSQTVTCTRSDVLGTGAVAPTIVVTVSVSSSAPALVVNTASVSGGGNPPSANDSDDDPTAIGGTFIFANGFEGN